jgi:hypothetical protein
MGCGWTANDTDWSRVVAIEVVNGASLRLGREEGPASGISFWERLLDQGHRITAIGGSDNHDATDREGARQSPVGRPATVVHASELSTKGIVGGVKSGRVFIDLANTPGAVLDAEGRAGAQSVKMGGVLVLRPDEQAHFIAAATGVKGSIAIVSHNLTTTESDSRPPSQTGAVIRLRPGAAFGWVRAEVRDAGGKLVLLGNPIYVRAAQ